MALLLKYFLIVVCVAVTVGREFRFDYVYYPYIDGWLKLHLIPATWRDAFRICEAEGTVLASPTDTKMKYAMTIHSKTSNKSTCGIYSGVHATFSKGYFFSIEEVGAFCPDVLLSTDFYSGKIYNSLIFMLFSIFCSMNSFLLASTPLTKMPVSWTLGKPDNANNNEDCILFLNDGTIADVDCSVTYPYMCFKKNTNDMVTKSCGTIDKDYEYSRVTGNCYKFHGVGTIWQHASMTCAAEGGYLTIINSRDEADVLKKVFERNYNNISPGTNNDLVYVGIHDWGDHGVWRTVHGMRIGDAGYAEWNNGQPDNATGGQFCGAMFRNTKLDDYWCGRTAPFICEKCPDSLL